MPVEVRELIIKAEVTVNLDDEGDCQLQADELVEMCVEQVLKVLERSQER